MLFAATMHTWISSGIATGKVELDECGFWTSKASALQCLLLTQSAYRMLCHFCNIARNPRSSGNYFRKLFSRVTYKILVEFKFSRGNNARNILI